MERKVYRVLVVAVILSFCSFGCGTDPVEENVDSSKSASPSSISSDKNGGYQAGDVQVWSLGGNGWALRLGEKVLIFDYVSRGDPNPPGPGEERNLNNGYIDPLELENYEVYVFVTHSHSDHFDQVIFEWQDQIDRISYIFGWEAGSAPDHYYLTEPRSHLLLDDLEIYTINSFSDVPEVAYLVLLDGLAIYHNGDYQGSYREDFDYLLTIADQIEITFVIGWPYESHQNFQQAEHLIEIFNPLYVFAICREGNEDKSQLFSEMMREREVESQIIYPEQRGEDFLLFIQ